MVKRFSTRYAAATFPQPAVFYSLLSFSILYSMWPYFYYIKSETLIVLGAFTVWRYSWQLTHYVRSAIYGFIDYPRLRREALDRDEEAKYPAHVYFIIPSYREEAWVTAESFRSIFSNMASIPCSATLVVATGSDQDDAIISALYEAHPVRDKVDLVLQRQEHGKRTAMGHAIRAMARRHDDDPRSVTVFMDGDSYLQAGTLEKTIPFFARFRDLGALTTNELAFINTHSAWYKDWFNLKFGQRHVLFQSHALSRKVLTLTGRFSIFRTSIVVEEDFIRQIENDVLTHWMHGKFRFLMGDDKSSWFYVLKHGWNMLYVPDVTCYSLESRTASFFALSMSLPYRWYGNTLRNNARALALGPRKTGFFIWLAILDQRLSMWTALVGITGAIVLAIFKSFIYLPFYIAWVLMVRVVQMFTIAMRGHPVSMLTIPLMMYNQWIGACIKIRAHYHLADQTWSKSGMNQRGDEGVVRIRHPLARWMPTCTMVLASGVFVFAMLLAQGALSLPDRDLFRGREAGIVLDAADHGLIVDDGADDTEVLQSMIDRLPIAGERVIELPPGRVDLFRPLRLRSHVALRGSDRHATTFVSHLTREDGAALQLHGSVGPVIARLADDTRPDQRRLTLPEGHGVRSDDLLLIKMPNDDSFLRQLGSERWNREYPYLRQALARVSRVRGTTVDLEYPLGLSLARGVTTVQKVEPITDVRLEDFTLRQEVPGAEPSSVRHVYENRHPEYAADSIGLKWAAHILLDDLVLLDSGRHPLAFDGVYDVTASNLRIDGAWNKGKRGNGYVKLARTYHSRFVDSEVDNIRHIVLQWSSAFNTLSGIRSGVDINLHGGFTHHNRIEHSRLDIPARHPWRGVVRTPPDAHWAPPDGENLVLLGDQ